MYNVLNISLPFFLLIFLGIFLNYVKFLNLEAARTLSKTAFYLLMPPMIFLNLAYSDIRSILDLKFLAQYEIATVFLFLIAIPIGKFFKFEFNKIGMFGLISAYPNYGYIGIPLTLLALGPSASAPVALILFSNTFMLLFLTSIFLGISDGQQSLSKTLYAVLRGLLVNPLILSVVAGITFAYTSISIPKPVNDTLYLLSKAAPPVALIALGASLRFKSSQSGLWQISLITFIKLIIHPSLIFLIFTVWPFPDETWVRTAIICSSLPVAANVFVLASTYNTAVDESTNSIFVSTLLSSITVPIILYIILNI